MVCSIAILSQCHRRVHCWVIALHRNTTTIIICSAAAVVVVLLRTITTTTLSVVWLAATVVSVRLAVSVVSVRASVVVSLAAVVVVHRHSIEHYRVAVRHRYSPTHHCCLTTIFRCLPHEEAAAVDHLHCLPPVAIIRWRCNRCHHRYRNLPQSIRIYIRKMQWSMRCNNVHLMVR